MVESLYEQSFQRTYISLSWRLSSMKSTIMPPFIPCLSFIVIGLPVSSVIPSFVVGRCPSKDSYKMPPHEDDTFYIPDEDPNSHGRWRGFLVHNVKATVLPHVLQEYDNQWLAYQNQVIFSS